jgi:hypothetical protein
MSPDPTETLLRDALQSHRHDAGPGASFDPWLRVSRAHRQSRLRRRTAAAGALVSVAAMVTSLAGTQPWAGSGPEMLPSDESGAAKGLLRLDDGRSRGALGNDPALRRAVIKGLRKAEGSQSLLVLKQPDTVHVLWAGILGDRRVALTAAVLIDAERASRPTLSWLTGPAKDDSMHVVDQVWEGPAMAALPYSDGQGGQRLLAVVRRGAKVSAARTVISPDRGRIVRDWQPVQAKDGVVDLAVPNPLGRGPLILRAQVGSEKPEYVSSANTLSAAPELTPARLSSEEIAAAAKHARGPGLPPDRLLSLSRVVQFLRSDAAHTDPRVEWAGPVPAARGGGSLDVASAGLPGQGRILEIVRASADHDADWMHAVTLPAGALEAGWAGAWRLPTPTEEAATGQVVVWMFGRDFTSVEVTVNGKVRPSITDDGLGWLEIDPEDEVVVTGHRARNGNAEITLHAKDVEASTGGSLFGLGR